MIASCMSLFNGIYVLYASHLMSLNFNVHTSQISFAVFLWGSCKTLHVSKLSKVRYFYSSNYFLKESILPPNAYTLIFLKNTKSVAVMAG